MSTTKTLLVIGGTGKQGTCFVRHFLTNNKQWKLRILTRNPDSQISKEFASKGAEIVHGDLKQKETVERSMKDAKYVFMCLDPWQIGGVNEETRIGREIVDMAVRFKVEHFVYTSVASSDKKTGIPHFESKWKVEQHLTSSGLPFTILKPVFFMENLLGFKEFIEKGTLPLALKPTTRLQMIACTDIGAFAVMAFNNKKEWEGKSIELAGDEMTMEEYAKEIRCKFESVPLEKVSSEEMRLMYKWFMETGYHTDITQVKKWYPNYTTFKKWVSTISTILKMPEGTQ